jgi:hypothetical protein
MRYYYDTEFIEDGSTIDLISIGIVAEDGREYYAQSSEFNLKKASQWVWDNVLGQLKICPYVQPSKITLIEKHLPHELKQHSRGKCIPTMNEPERHRCPWRTREHIADEVRWFLNAGEGTPELWGYYSAYDHVAFCQLFGTMMDLPKGFPMYTRDLKQWCDALGNPKLPEQEVSEHHALADARWNRLIWQFLKEVK